MEKVLCIYKPIGITPLQIIHTLRKQHPEYQHVKLGYAGRLDPMAEGLLLVLVGEENKNRKQYEELAKEYTCEILFGIATDTYDVLGKIISSTSEIQEVDSKVKQILPTFVGKYKQPYPPYSSQPVNGKPLYYWARRNKLANITIPTKNIEMYAIELLSYTEMPADVLRAIIYKRIATVSGDFRQEEILTVWKDFFEYNANRSFSLFHLRISCSSGTYIRSFAHRLGKQIGTGAIALNIKRTKIGDYNIENAIHLL